MESTNRPSHFLREIIARDVAEGTHGGRVAMRFPPEPNGFPHLGHAKSICLNFGLAEEFGGTCNLRYDDTNPETERPEYVEALAEAVRWLGFEPAEVLHTSDYFEQLYAMAQQLVRDGLAYVDSQDGDAIRAGRGTVTEPGTPSPFRDRDPEESLRLLDEMRRGEHADGSHVLRARIDDPEHGPMAHPNMKLRDPVMYRIRRGVPHYRRGTEWSIYPLYDWAHGQSDAIERITHSVCTLEFDVNRPLYDWYLDALGIEPPRNRQHEFARLNLDYTVMSKRKLLRLVEEGHVAGWDDPRMPTIAGQRRRGVRPEAIRAFCEAIGVSKVDGRVELAQYEYAIRSDLNGVAPRVMAVTDPVPLTITNLDAPVTVEAALWPHDVTPPEDTPTSRPLTLSRELWIEREDVTTDPPKGWRRLAPDAEVRLRHGFVIRCTSIETDDEGRVTAVTAEADLDTLGRDPEGRTVRGVIHWASQEHARPATFRLYDRLFRDPAPDALDDFLQALNPESLVVREGFVEPYAVEAASEADARFQFERSGYFWPDPEGHAPDAPVFNRIVTLKDGWAKASAKVTLGNSDQAIASIARAKKKVAAPQPERDLTAGFSDDQLAAFGTYVDQGVGEEEAAVLATDAALAALFAAIEHEPRATAVLLVHDLRPALAESAASQATPQALAGVLRLTDAGTLTRKTAAEAVGHLVREGGTAEAVVERHELAAIRDDAALVPVVQAIIEAHPDEARRFRAGEGKLLGFLMGQAMRRAPKGTDAARVRELLTERLVP